jgi:hypothetical protein
MSRLLKHWVRDHVSSIGRRISYLGFLALIRFSRRKWFFGLETVQVAGGKRDGADLFGKIYDALCLISRVDPLTLARVQQNLRRILILKLKSSYFASYWPDLDAAVQRRHRGNPCNLALTGASRRQSGA